MCALGGLMRCRDLHRYAADNGPSLSAQLRQIHCEPFEIGERAVGQSSLMSGAQDHAGRLACFKCFLPAWCTQTPTVIGFQARKSEIRHWCRKIVAVRFRKIEERRCHNDAHRVTTNVLSSSVAAAVTIKPRHGFD